MQQPSLSANHDTATFDWRSRLRAAGIHLGLSALVAAIVGSLVFALWYPFPYRDISGGSELFRLVVTVDVILGPLLTFAVFNRRKPGSELRRDLAIVVALQLAGLGYGLYTVGIARPVHMVFEYDRFRVVHRADIPDEALDKVPASVDVAPWSGPTPLALRQFKDEQERLQRTLNALSGYQLGAQPDLWEPYEAQRAAILAAAKPITELKKRFPSRAAELDAALREAGADAAHAAYLPLVARKAEAWTVLLDATDARILGYVPIDSF
jgi:hypothetical protein